jgi:Glycosyltransferase 61
MPMTLPNATLVRQLKQQDFVESQACYFGTNAELANLLRSYIAGIGTFDDWTHHKIRERINSMSDASGVANGSVFDQYGQLDRMYVKHAAPELADALFEVVPEGLTDTYTIVPESTNEYHDADSLTPNNMLLQREVRPSFRVYGITGVDLYVDPYRYQLVDRFRQWFIPSASSRSLSKVAIARATEIATVEDSDKHLVIIQDRFPGSNFAHFLFDWVTRIGHFCECGIADPGDCRFIMGGAPGPFEEIVLGALMARYELRDDSFLFPSRPMVLRTAGSMYWFSDQVETYMHPAQMAHERSVEIIRSLARDLSDRTPSLMSRRFKRIYISRADAARRRIANEVDLYNSLRRFGFDYVVMSDHSPSDQISIIRRAECVVAPHGMALTLLSLHCGAPALVELHQPGYGTDAYAFVAKAMRFPYRSVVGNPGYDDFCIPVDGVLRAVADLGFLEQMHNGEMLHEARTLTATDIPGGLSSGAGVVEVADVWVGGAAITAGPIMRHARVDPEQRIDSNVGAWINLPLEEGLVYTASCWIWVPREFSGSAIMLSIGEWSGQRRVMADLSIRDCWQRLQTSRTAPSGSRSGHIVLRLSGPDGAFIFSSGWRLDAGPLGLS